MASPLDTHTQTHTILNVNEELPSPLLHVHQGSHTAKYNAALLKQ